MGEKMQLSHAQLFLLKKLNRLCEPAGNAFAFNISLIEPDIRKRLSARRSLHRMKRRGLVEHSPAISAFAGDGFAITAAGRAALSRHGEGGQR